MGLIAQILTGFLVTITVDSLIQPFNFAAYYFVSRDSRKSAKVQKHTHSIAIVV